jgi:hypothetical protein
MYPLFFLVAKGWLRRCAVVNISMCSCSDFLLFASILGPQSGSLNDGFQCKTNYNSLVRGLRDMLCVYTAVSPIGRLVLE